MTDQSPNVSAHIVHHRHRRHHHRHYHRTLTKAHYDQAPLPPHRPSDLAAGTHADHPTPPERPFDLAGTPYINPQAHAAEHRRTIGLLNGDASITPYANAVELVTPAAQGASAGHGFGWRAGVEVPMTEKFAVLGEVGQSTIGDIRNTTNTTHVVTTQVPVGHGRYMPATTTAQTTTPSVTRFDYNLAMGGVSADLGKITGWEALKAFKMDLLGGAALGRAQTDYTASTVATTTMNGATVNKTNLVTPGQRHAKSIGGAGAVRVRANLNTLLEQAGGPSVKGVQAEIYGEGLAADIKATDGKTRMTGGYGGGIKLSVPF